MTDYQFTQDWFSWNEPVWQQLVPILPEGESYAIADRPVRHFLEIGSFEGRSAVWIMEHMMKEHDSLTCIDTWAGGEEHVNGEMDGAESRFNQNVELAHCKFPKRHVHKVKCDSVLALSEEIQEARGWYSFIYIDGSHVGKDVMTDACMAWPLLRDGGIMVFDDYLWGEPLTILHKPKIAIDYFVTLFAEELEYVHLGYQLIVRKRSKK